jgi:hypothetical protein
MGPFNLEELTGSGATQNSSDSPKALTLTFNSSIYQPLVFHL